MSERMISLNSEQFEQFLRGISILKDICNDIDIRDGIVRQRTNDNSSIFEIDMTDLISDVSIPLFTLKTKIDLLKVFYGNEVNIKIDDTHFSFSDDTSELSFQKPDLDYLDNKFMPQEELDNIFQLSEEQVMLSVELSERITDRMRVITQTLNTPAIRVVFNGEHALIETTTSSRDQAATFLKDLVVDIQLENASSLLTTIPFIIDHDGDVEFKMYQTSETVSSNTFETSMDDIKIMVYSRSNILLEGDA